MLYVLCTGGLGNQMFQFAYLKHIQAQGREVVLDTSYYLHNSMHSGYALERAFGIIGYQGKDHFNTIWKIRYTFMAKTGRSHFHNILMEHHFMNAGEAEIPSNSVLYGFWQGETFFYDVRKEVKKEFKFINISKRTKKMAKEIESCSSIAVHVRRGDYLNNGQYINLCETNYYKRAIEEARIALPNPILFVFSDDIEWCKNSGLFGRETEYVDYNDNKHAYEDMYLMTKAKAAIIANSSFSWWGGYLGEHRFVIRPKKYKTKWTDEQDGRLYPREWLIGEL